MREIKFRVWVKTLSKGSMGEVARIDFNEGTTWYFWKEKAFFAYLKHCKLMQYTGLKDKNGVEIYEGDILKTSEGLYEVSYMVEKVSFMIDDVYSYMSYYLGDYEMEHFEVIGNIYENPELVEVER